MVTINTTDDLLRLLDENEQFRAAVRNKILTEDLIRLPSEFEEFKEETKGFQDDMREFKKDTEKFRKETKERFNGIDKRFDGIDTALNALRGNSLEDRLTNTIPPLVTREFGVRRPYPMWRHGFLPPDERIRDFRQTLESATDSGKIADADESRVRVTDLIVRTQKKADLLTLWFVIEASGVINHRDITRARHSALTLMKVYEQEVVALVYGYQISQSDRNLAESLKVMVFLDSDRS